MDNSLNPKRWDVVSKDFVSKNLIIEDQLIQKKTKKRKTLIFGLISFYLFLLIVSLFLL